MNIYLCTYCKEIAGNEKDRFLKSEQEHSCQVCQNKCEKLPAMIDESISYMKKHHITSFSISTLLPKDFLTLEEDVWDFALDSERSQSTKNLLNRKISSQISKSANAIYSKDGQLKIIFDFTNEKVNFEYNDVFVFGRYKKYDNTLSQSRWTCGYCEGSGCEKCDNSGKKFISIEEKIGIPLQQLGESEDYVLHASGREDVDAFNSGGRAFVLMLKKAKKALREQHLNIAAEKIAEDGKIKVENLKIVNRAFVELVTESHFDKEYEAEIELGREITTEDLKKIESISGRTLNQQTPQRVMHRRADLIRNRKVKTIKVVWHQKNKAAVKILAEAGTYIKELISGDEGRTDPSINQMLNCSAICTKLTVTKIDDGFLDFVLEKITLP